MKVSCSIFIPAYNAEKTIADVISRIDHETWQHIDNVFIVNDGSHDKTAAIVDQQSKNCGKLKLFSFRKNQGYGNAVSKGIQLCLETQSDYIVCLHADGQYPPENILQFINYMDERGIDILQGQVECHSINISQGNVSYGLRILSSGWI